MKCQTLFPQKKLKIKKYFRMSSRCRFIVGLVQMAQLRPPLNFILFHYPRNFLWQSDESEIFSLTLCMLGNFACFFCRLWIFFKKLTFSKKSFRNIIRVSNSLDPDQAWRFVRLELGPNCLHLGYQQTTKVTTSEERVKTAQSEPPL